jgi:type IV pilus assembly protein PilE
MFAGPIDRMDIRTLLRLCRHKSAFFADQVRYTDDLMDLGYASATAVPSVENFYEVTASACIDAPIDRCILLSAVAQTDQASDGDLTLDSRGAKTGYW